MTSKRRRELELLILGIFAVVLAVFQLWAFAAIVLLLVVAGAIQLYK